jgi:hypothetical protein
VDRDSKTSQGKGVGTLTINFDGSLQLQGAGAGILVMPPKEESFKYASWSMDHHGTWHLPTQGSQRLTARCQSGQQRVVMSRRQNADVLLRALQVRKKI